MKNLLICTAAAFAFLVAGAVAQTSTTSPADQGTQSASPSMNGQQGAAAPDSTQGVNSTGAQGSTAATTSSNSATEKKMKGCIQSQGGQYVLQTKRGKDVMLTGQDVSAHVGHEVTVHGMWAGAMSGMSNTSSGTASAGAHSFNVTSVDMISETCSMGKGGKSGMSGGSGMSGSDSSAPSATPNSGTPATTPQ